MPQNASEKASRKISVWEHLFFDLGTKLNKKGLIFS